MKNNEILILLGLGAFLFFRKGGGINGLNGPIAKYTDEANKRLKKLSNQINEEDKIRADYLIKAYRPIKKMSIENWEKLENLTMQLPDVVIAYLALHGNNNFGYIGRKILTSKGIL